jgi:serpin B
MSKHASAVLALALVASPGACTTVQETAHEGPEPVDGLVEAANAFTADVFRAVAGEPGNTCVSPFSIHGALFLVHAGARGASARDLERVLGLTEAGLGGEAGHAALADLVARIRRADEDGRVEVANALWGQQGYPFSPDCTALVARHHGAAFHAVDFRSGTAVARINAWVEESTHGLIREVLGEGDVGPATRLVLTNTLYLRTRWAQAFLEGRTSDEDFHLSPGETVDVPTMHAEVQARFAEHKGVRIAELDCRTGLSVLLVVPREGTPDATALQAALTPERLRAWLAPGRQTRIELALPRFRFETRLELHACLEALGLGALFGPQADLSGWNDGREHLALDRALHQTQVAVDEHGIEAAAATAVGVVATSLPGGPLLELAVDRPFLFLVLDAESRQVLFAGRVLDPR